MEEGRVEPGLRPGWTGRSVYYYIHRTTTILPLGEGRGLLDGGGREERSDLDSSKVSTGIYT